MVSAYFIDRRISEKKRPRYGLVMSLVAFFLFASAMGGALGWWGVFGQEALLGRDYFFLSFLCAASGFQNAALTSASGATIRTTHLTGITTDLGIGLVRASALRDDDPVKRREAYANLFRAGTIFAFMLGSAIGAFLYLRYQYLGFLMPFAIAVYVTAIAYRDERDPH